MGMGNVIIPEFRNIKARMYFIKNLKTVGLLEENKRYLSPKDPPTENYEEVFLYDNNYRCSVYAALLADALRYDHELSSEDPPQPSLYNSWK